MLFMKVIAVYCEDLMKPMKTLYETNSVFFCTVTLLQFISNKMEPQLMTLVNKPIKDFASAPNNFPFWEILWPA
jgi:hypothetical protein